MTDLLYDAVARIARHEADARSWATIGTVTDVHGSAGLGQDYAVSVRLRDSEVVVPRLPLAVGALGFVATPAVGDVVVVVFADGDPHGGIVVGRLYHRDLQPPEHADGQLVLELPPGSDDIAARIDANVPEITLKVGDATVTVQSRKATVEIGGSKLEISDEGAGSATLEAGDARIELNGGGEVTVEASATLTLKASEITIEGSGRVAISGGVVEVN